MPDFRMNANPTILWLRKDLRLDDHPALSWALEQGGPVLPVYILDPHSEGTAADGEASRAWLHRSLASLAGRLTALGSRLILRRGPSLEVLLSLVRETGAGAVTWNRRYEPDVVRRDSMVKKNLLAAGIQVRSFNGSLLFAPNRVENKAGQPFRVFTPYWKNCLGQAIRPAISFNLDRWVMDGQLKFVWVFGTTWVAAMMASNALEARLRELTRGSRHQITSTKREAIFETLKRRVDAGGMVMVDSDIYPVAPIGSEFADIVLPAATWGESDFTRCNSERRLRLYSKFYDAPGDARPDWWAVQKFAQKMGYDKDGSYAWKDGNDVFEEAARFSRNGVLNYHPLVEMAKSKGIKGHEMVRSLGTTGIQTPIRLRDGQLVGTQRLHDPTNDWGEIEGVDVQTKTLYAFGTHSGKALLLKSPWKYPGWMQFYEAIKPRADRDEIWITNGRFNETWQSGFDDLRKPYLAQRWPDSGIVIHPDDAKAQGIESGDYVEVVNDTVYVQTGQPQGVLGNDQNFDDLLRAGHIRVTEGRFVAVAIVSDEMRPGVAMANFNFPSSPANAVVSAVPDPITNNYRYKLGRGALRRMGESPFKHSFTQMTLKPRSIA